MSFVDVSVLVTCFNKEAYLAESIDSVFRQTKSPKEIILVHDGCYEAQAYDDVETIILRRNYGVAYARQKAFLNSTGKLILFLDGDDVLSPDYIENTILTIYDGADIAYSNTYFWGSSPSVVNTPQELTPEYVFEHKKTTINSASLIKREVYEQLQGFRELKAHEDVDFYLRALSENFILKKANTLLWYRQIPGSRSRYEGVEEKTVFNKILDQFTITEQKVVLNDG